MLQLFDSPATGAMGKPAGMQSAMWSVIIHGTVGLFLLTLGLSSAFQALPEHFNLVALAVPLPPPPPPPPPLVASGARTVVKRVMREFDAKLIAPVAVPVYAPVTILDAPPDLGFVEGVIGGVPGGMRGGVLAGVVGGVQSVELPLPPPPPPPPPVVNEAPPPEAPQRIQVNASVQEAKLLQMVRPVYPPAAKLAHIEGSVVLTAIIDAEGNIADLRIMGGHPLLAAAARAAVEKWRYRPTFLGGKAVEVATDIIVNFRLI